jgi:hypothetical protein
MATDIHSEIATRVLSAKAAAVLHAAVEAGLVVEPNASYTEWLIKHPTSIHTPRIRVILGLTGKRSADIELLCSVGPQWKHRRWMTEADASERVARMGR